ncbi:uncharacterized protein LOC109201964 [Oreochromis niloticus]|uniref:uncharacterized protein LOC109201964 n=1 Tax=Oreochromis niloticus TaxID=8128 RepID=UPI000DF3A374|nr:uncharacterized protein LOC109201964 [Oreochromis niloticus]XP_025762394.1 uncharacterized protein LOC109201964 [Oreochromis niloticus]XP_025762395.1 uncharacterized protein LOC109201964 [Oreochromis niloticus]
MGRWTLLVTLTTMLTLTGPQLMPTTAEPQGRQKRWTHDNSHLRDMTQDHIHPWMNNAWYRYIHDRTRAESENTDCYVCSYMPSTSTHPTLYGKYMNNTQAKCAASFAGIGLQHSQIILEDTNPSTFYTLHVNLQGGLQRKKITVEDVGLDKGVCDQLFWINFNVTNRNTSIHFPVFLDQTPGKNHSMCYKQSKGNRPLGNTTNCNRTAGGGEGAPVDTTGPSNGTYWVQGMAWLCGQRAYFILPPSWTGTCAPIFLSDHTFRMTAVNTTSTVHRKRRSTPPEIQPHDPIWGSDVPKEGGLCVIFNNTCCTYIPDNVHSSNMTDALNALRQIQQAQNQDYVSDTGDWFSWLYTGSWLQVLKRLLIGVGIFLLLFCVFATCILPCLKLMINRIIVSTVAAYIAVTNDDDDSDLLEHENFV